MNWKLTRVLLLLVLVLPVLGTAQTVFYTESFETDGEGSRYNSNTFSDCPSPNFFLRTNTNPVTPPSCTGGFSSTLVLSPLQGTFFWAGEDIAGPLPPGSLTSQSINISGQSAMTISLYIACSNNGGTIWETGDSLNIQVNIDGGGFSTVGRFMGTDNFGGNLAMDSNLDGIINGSDNGVLADQATFAKYTFSIPGTGSSMQFNIDFDINGGTEEIAVDLIEVSGVFAPPSTPEINLVGNGQTINDGDLSPTGTDHTSFGSVLECTGTISRTFTIQNSGPAVLNLTGTPRVQVSGTNAADFTVTSQPTATVAASGGSTTFTVQFDPSGTGTRSAVLSIDNNDSDENPYDFAINGVGLFDNINPTVMCPANQTEAVNSSCQVSLPDYASLVTTSDNCPGAVTLTQTPSAGTIFSGVGTSVSVSMVGRDGNLNASTCTFTTTLVGSEINVQYVNSNVLDGSTAPTFGNQLVCTGNTEHVFVVHNLSSTTALNISGVTVSGANAGDFTVTGSPAATIAPNDSSNLTVRFDPTATGPRSASIDIANDDCDESLYNFTVEGVGDPDNVDPIVTCPPNQTYNLGAACQGLLPDYRSLVTSSDNCGSVTETQTPSPGTTISGTVSVTVSGRDAALNASSCTFSTVGQDTTSPTVTCQDISVVLGGTTASITAGMVTAASGDNCALAGASVSPSSFTCSNIGANNVTLTVTDVNSNTANCTAVVTVQDTTQPTALCQNITTFIQVNDTASITAGDIDNGSNDNCSFSLGISQSDFTCNDLIGTQSVTLTVSDNSGNIDSCTAQVTVQDTAGYCCATPILAGGGQTDTVCLSGGTTFVLTSSGDVDSLRWEVSTNNGSTWSILTDAMPNYASTTSDSLVISGAPFSFDNNQYRLVAYGCGATVMSTPNILRVDPVPPNALCQDISIHLDGAGMASIAAGDIDNGSNDACGTVSLVASQTAFTCAELGGNPVLLTVTDTVGNTDTCSATVTVIDSIAPVMATLDCGTSNAEDAIYDNGWQSGDNDGSGFGPWTLTASTGNTAQAGHFVGTSTANGAAVDSNSDDDIDSGTRSLGMYANSSQGVDATRPIIGTFTIGSQLRVEMDNGFVDPGQLAVFQLQNAGGNSLGEVRFRGGQSTYEVIDLNGLTPIAGFPFTDEGIIIEVTAGPTGLANVSVTRKVDGVGQSFVMTLFAGGGDQTIGRFKIVNSNNGVGAASNLYVNNMSACILSPNCPSNVSTTTQPGICGAVVAYDSVVAVDNCTGITAATQTTGLANGATFPLGTTNNTFTGTDVSGNTASCGFTVTVADGTPPTANCQNITVVLDGSGSASIVAADIDSSSTDACGIMSYSISDTSFTCADIGANTVTLMVTDSSSNVGSCTATVTVEDTLPPITNCQNTTIQLDSTGLATLAPSQIDSSSSDACGIMNLSVSDTLFTCSDVGANSVTLTVTDSSSNSSTCTATVTVEDNTPPVAVCQNITVFLDGSGSATITTGDIDNGSSDVCGIDSLMLSMTSFACANVGTNSVTLTVTDNSGNVDTCSAVVTVNDSIPPVASCQNAAVFLDGSGNATITAAAIDSSSNDACGIMSLALSDTSFTCADRGANGVTLTVTDNNGNTATCTATVTVNDSIAPTAICNNITVQLDSNGLATLAPSQIDSSSFDVCGIMNFSVSDTLFTCSDVGANSVTLTVTDSSSNSSTCTATVTVEDNTPPVAVCQNITVFLDGSGSATITTGDIDNGSSDVCGIDSLMLSMTSFACANVGPNSVTLTVTDNSGNVDTCSAVVTVNDSIPPVASCQNATVFLDGSGNATITAAAIDSSSNDACGIMSLALSDTSFTCADRGANGVTLTVTDNNGNTATCTATVTVNDSIPPTPICQNITVQLDSNGLVTLVPSQIDSGSFDVCGIMNLSVSDTLFTCSNLGSNTVTLTVTDSSSNSSTCTSTVTVEDNLAPNANCQSITVFLDGAGSATITSANIDNGSTDNCTIDSMVVAPSAFSCSDVGANSVTLLVTDQSGNTDTCSATVTVTDSIAPTAICQNTTIYLDGSGNASLTATQVDSSSFDVCGIANIAVSDTAFNCADIGTNTVTLTVTDSSGNMSTCTSTVTVEDSIAPTPICQNLTLQLDSTGFVGLSAAQVDSSSFDNCGSVSLMVSDTAFSCAHVGANTVTLTVTDGSSNASTCTSTITVEDNVLPNVVCQNDTLYLNGAGSGSIVAGDIDNGSSDACGIDTMVVNPNSFNCGNIGANAVTLFVTDNNGNMDSCSATVIVIDSIAPTAICQNITVQLDSAGTASIIPSQIDSLSFDACGIDSMSVSPSTFNCGNVGTNTVTLTLTDSSGNASTCTGTVTIEDSVPPVALCQNITVYLDTAGMASINVAQIDSGSTDACGIDSLVISNSMFDCNNTVASLSVLPELLISEYIEGSGFEKYIEIYNGTGQTVDLSNYELRRYTNGSATVSASNALTPGGMLADGASVVFKNGSATGFAGGTVLSVVNWNGDDAVELFNTNTGLTVDIFGNIGNDPGSSWTGGGASTANQTLRRKATVSGGVTVNPGGSGPAAFTTLATEWDNFPINDVSGLGAHTVSLSGSNSVTLTVTDVNGNVSTCIAEVTVIDSISPTVNCSNITVQLDTAGNATIVTGDVGTSTDECGITSEMLSQSVFACGDLGANSITYTATDASGNATSCVGVVTIEDTLPPVWVNCPSNDSVFADSASCASSVVWTAPSVSDNCSIANSTNNFNSGDPFPIGNTTVSYIATDSSGNSDSCTFVITVTAQPLLATVTIPTTACGFNLNCAADNNGTATVAPNGGCLPYQYAWSNGDTSAMASNLSAGTYYVTVTDSLGTVWTDSLNVTAPMPLALTHVADSLVCGNDTTGTIDLSVTGGNTCAAYSFLWSNGATTEDISGLMAGTYTVTVTDTLGCMAVLSHTFMQGIVPTPNLGVDTAKCPNTAIILQLDSAYAGYMWSTGDSTSTTSVIATGTYWVEVSSAEGCVGSDTIVVTDFVVDNDIITTMGSLTICDGDSVVMVADSGLTNWVWSTGGTTATEVIAGFGGPVTLTANDANGCVVTDTETVNYVQFTDPIPVITPGPTANLCDGDEMNLNVQTGYFSYLWSNGETTQTILINTPGLYQVTVSNGFGCEAVSDPVTVTGVPLPTATLALNNGVLSTTTPFSSYQWYMDGNIIAGAIQPTYTPTMAGWYSVMVSDSNGCSGNSDSIYVNPVSIDTELLELEGLVLYPNPSSGLVNLRTEHPIPGKMEIEVWDMYGQKVKVFKLSQLISDVDFDLTDIANGMYLMKISTKRGQQRSATMIRFMIE